MNAKIVLPWICAIGLGAALAATFASSRAKDSELSKLRADNAQLQQAQKDLDDAQNRAKVLEAQVADFKTEKEELLRLRGEVSQLRGEKQQLSKQVQIAQNEAQRAQSQISQAAVSASRQMQQLQSENQQLRGVATQGEQIATRDACINNLRQIDAAKQQWALENNKTADAVPAAADISPYLKDHALPVCPGGGTYSINAVTNVPTCSIAGHTLSQ